MTAKNGKSTCSTVAAVEARISKSILPTYGTFPRGRSHILHGHYEELSTKCDVVSLQTRLHIYGVQS